MGIELKTSTEVESVEKRDDGSLAVGVASAESSQSIEADLVVHGAGRVPNTAGLDLETGEVRFGFRSGIEVNEYLQSISNPAVYAAGDVAATDVPPLSPVAIEEGRILAHNLLNDEQTEAGLWTGGHGRVLGARLGRGRAGGRRGSTPGAAVPDTLPATDRTTIR